MPRIASSAIALLLILSAALSAGDAADAPKVAVLRLIDAINASKTYQARIDGFKKDQAQVQARIKELEDGMQKLSTSLDALPQGSDKIAGIQEELETTKSKHDAFVRRMQGEFERRQIALIKESYQQTIALLAEFCKARGIKIVVQAANTDFSAPDRVVMNLRVEMQTALYYDADQDITDAFVGFVNARAEAAPGGK